MDGVGTPVLDVRVFLGPFLEREGESMGRRGR